MCRGEPSHALLLQDLGRKQLQSAPFWLTLDIDVFAIDALLSSWTSLARAKFGREQVRVENPTLEQVFDGHFLQAIKNPLDHEWVYFQFV